jgi:hypothetical protein
MRILEQFDYYKQVVPPGLNQLTFETLQYYRVSVIPFISPVGTT